MTQGEHLYERATVDTGGLPPLWHVDNGRALFAGPLGHNARHRHSTPVYLAGLYGTFGLRIDEGEWLSCRTAVIPAGVPYEFDMSGNPLAVLYVEPNVAGVDALTPLVRSTREVNGALVGSTGEVSLMRELYEDRCGAQWAGVALNDIVDFSKRRGAREIDPRVSRIVEAKYERYDELTPVAQLASSVGLSASRRDG